MRAIRERLEANGAMPETLDYVDTMIARASDPQMANVQSSQAQLMRMLTRTRWNRKEAAEILGISYKALLYKIKEAELDKAS